MSALCAWKTFMLDPEDKMPRALQTEAATEDELSVEALRLVTAFYRLRDPLKRAEIVALTERYADQI